jgi:SAM-dependent methyltransferase
MEAEKLRTYKPLVQTLPWQDDALYAKVAHFAFQEDINAAVASYAPELISMSVEYGYLAWPRKIQNFILNKSVLDVGCGFGGYGIGFLVAGARSYTGLDPAMDLDSNKAKNKRTRSIALMPKTPRQIMAAIPRIRLIQGKSEDIAHQGQYDVISLHNVTEHLMDIDRVFMGFLPLMKKETRIVFLHHHFFCWNGHHMAPARLEDFDEASEAHRKYADWAHVIHGNAYPENDYIKTGLNQVSLAALKTAVETYFQIFSWEEEYSREAVLKRLTPELIEKALAARPEITRKDLEVQTVFCVAERII